MTATSQPSADLDKVIAYLNAIRARVGKVVVGQDVVVERCLIALLTGGHLLLQGVPGLAKTLLVSVLSRSIDLHFARVQFTIDLLPSDILGSEILDQRTSQFKTRKGPVFTNLLLADEINRAAPKVQGALLEAMQERRVTIGDETFSLPAPFLVIATQNPVEQAGTFELPEAQLDRFMLCHRLSYPTPDEEREVLRRNTNLGIQRSSKPNLTCSNENPSAAPKNSSAPWKPSIPSTSATPSSNTSSASSMTPATTPIWNLAAAPAPASPS
jgi:MoxR-like ATPase